MTATSPAGSPPRTRVDGFPIRIRELTLLRRVNVTPRMLRLTLGGPDTAGFESHRPDEHVKLVFPDPATGLTSPPTQDGDHLDWPKPFPPTRDYTVRRFDAAAGEVDLDVVAHPGGVAASWAAAAAIGSTIWVAGPRPGPVVPPEFGFLVLLGDETALPAIGRWLAELPADARGFAAVEVAEAAEEQDLRLPAGFTLRWLHRAGAPAGTSTLLADAVADLVLPADTWTYVWAAAEAGSVRPVRKWARARGIGKEQSDIGGYWKQGSRGNEVPRVARLSRSVRHAAGHVLHRDH